MAGKQRDLVLYFYTKPTTFVRRDINFLQNDYVVREFSFYHPSKWYTPVLFFKQLAFLIKHSTKSKLSFCMFAGYHSFFPALLNKIQKKPFVIILGGTECVSIKSIGYGIITKGLIGKFAQWSYQFTSDFAPVHQSLIHSYNTYDDSIEKIQGIKHYFPNLKANFTVIPNGFDPEKFKQLEHLKKTKNSFITVAFDLHKNHLYQLKGVDLIISIASYFPFCTFTIIGLSAIKNKAKNVQLLPSLSQDKLIEELSKNEFYFQLSMSEGFPNALCEAMLCNCIPIVSDVASMPEIIGDSGFLLKKRNYDLLKKLVETSVLKCDKETLAKKSRHRIINNYHIDQRKEKFLMLIESLTKLRQ